MTQTARVNAGTADRRRDARDRAAGASCPTAERHDRVRLRGARRRAGPARGGAEARAGSGASCPSPAAAFEGPKIRGRVVPGGADWQYVRSDGVLVVDARYTLETADSVLIMVTNRGLRHGPQAVMDRLGRGESVAPAEYNFRTAAEFEAPVGSKYEWLNQSVFIGVAERRSDAAIVRFYRVR